MIIIFADYYHSLIIIVIADLFWYLTMITDHCDFWFMQFNINEIAYYCDEPVKSIICVTNTNWTVHTLVLWTSSGDVVAISTGWYHDWRGIRDAQKVNLPPLQPCAMGALVAADRRADVAWAVAARAGCTIGRLDAGAALKMPCRSAPAWFWRL